MSTDDIVMKRLNVVLRKYSGGRTLVSEAAFSVAELATNENIDVLYSLLPPELQREFMLLAEHAHKGGKWRLLGSEFHPKDPISNRAKDTIGRWYSTQEPKATSDGEHGL